MVVIYILLALLGVAALLLYVLSRLVKTKGENPSFWGMLVLMIWGFCWLAQKAIDAWWIEGTERDVFVYKLYLISGTVLACLVGYMIVWAILLRKPNMTEWDKKLGDLGKKDH